MSILKQQNTEVSEFKFGKLLPVEGKEPPLEFKLQSLDPLIYIDPQINDREMRVEREFESLTAFEISKEIKEHRGLVEQEEKDYQSVIDKKVANKLDEIREKAAEEAFRKGYEDGKLQAYDEAKKEFEEKISEFSEHLTFVKNQNAEVYLKSQKDAYMMIKNLTKWVILKEVDEKYYLARLLEKLIHEINSKSSLVLHVNESSFGYMPEIVKIVERKVGKLENVRLEIDLDMKENGIKLEAENTIIDASLDAQLTTIDNLFKNVGLDE